MSCIEGIFGGIEDEVTVTGKPGLYHDISNEDYHAGPGISKSQLDLVSQSPALLSWSKLAPEDEAKKSSLNIGDAVHALLLEPHRFSKEFAVGPENAPRNTRAGKEKWAEFEAGLTGQKVITAEEFRMMELMKGSVMAHPIARWLIETEGEAEPSIYWTDPQTDLLCRCRMDKLIGDHGVIVDVKTTADIHKFKWSVRDYRYDVQDAFYNEGYRQHFGENAHSFVFLVVSTSIECGRYPVRVIELDEDSKLIGRDDMRRDLDVIATCTREDDWPGIEMLSMPRRQY